MIWDDFHDPKPGHFTVKRLPAIKSLAYSKKWNALDTGRYRAPPNRRIYT